MAWKFQNDTPIYLQIMDEIKCRIASGRLKPGDKVPPVRELALKAGVNPNTMQKALAELEREGMLYSNRTQGRFVAERNADCEDLRDSISKKYLRAYVDGMREIGYNDRELCDRLTMYLKEEGK